MRQAWAVVIALLILPADLSAASAVPVEDVLSEVDLFGNWAIDCSQEASPANPHVAVVLQSPGVVTESHDLGPDFAGNRYSVVSAARLPRELLAIEVIFRPGTDGEQHQKLTLLIRKGTRRTMFNQPDGGEVRVKDGVALGHGVKTPVLRKCGEGGA